MDKPTITLTVIGAPYWVTKSDIEFLVGRWGNVVSTSRGTASISSLEGVEGVWGSGWVWDKSWIVKVQCEVNTNIPTCVVACGDVWQIRYPGAPTVCFNCGDPQHLASHSKAQRRREAVVNRWEEIMCSTVEAFFPTKVREGGPKDEFLKEQKRNIRRGELFGMRKRNIQEAERDTLKEVEDKNKVIEDLKLKMERLEQNALKVTEEKDRVVKDLELAKLEEREQKGEIINNLEAKVKKLNEKSLKDHENFKSKDNDYRKKVKDFIASKEKEITALKDKCEEYRSMIDKNDSTSEKQVKRKMSGGENADSRNLKLKENEVDHSNNGSTSLSTSDCVKG